MLSRPRNPRLLEVIKLERSARRTRGRARIKTKSRWTKVCGWIDDAKSGRREYEERESCVIDRKKKKKIKNKNENLPTEWRHWKNKK